MKYLNNKLTRYFLFSFLIFSFTALFYAFYNNYSVVNTFSIHKSNKYTLNQGLSNNSFLKENSEPSFILLFIADTHENYTDLRVVKSQTESVPISHTFIIGDNTNFGDIPSLTKFKKETLYFSNATIIPGDHDIADSQNLDNFKSLFSLPTSITLNPYTFKISIIYNQYNFTPFSDSELKSALLLLQDSDMIIFPQPIYMPNNDIFSDKYMGNFSDDKSNLDSAKIKNLNVYSSQRDAMLKEIRKTKKPLLIISGDHHRSITFTDPINSLVTYHNLGAISDFVYFGGTKIKQKSLQPKRYLLLKGYLTEINSFNFVFDEKIID